MHANTVVVVACDGGEPSLCSPATTIVIKLNDANDAPPVFVQAAYSFLLHWTESITYVGTVLATDSDSSWTGGGIRYDSSPIHCI